MGGGPSGVMEGYLTCPVHGLAVVVLGLDRHITNRSNTMVSAATTVGSWSDRLKYEQQRNTCFFGGVCTRWSTSVDDRCMRPLNLTMGEPAQLLD